MIVAAGTGSESSTQIKKEKSVKSSTTYRSKISPIAQMASVMKTKSTKDKQ